MLQAEKETKEGEEAEKLPLQSEKEESQPYINKESEPALQVAEDPSLKSQKSPSHELTDNFSCFLKAQAEKKDGVAEKIKSLEDIPETSKVFQKHISESPVSEVEISDTNVCEILVNLSKCANTFNS